MAQTENESVTGPSQKCLNCKDQIPDDEPCRRGLCTTCYQAAHRAIKVDKLFDWDFLVAQGAALRATKGGRKKAKRGTTPLDRLINEARAKKVFGGVKKAVKGGNNTVGKPGK